LLERSDYAAATRHDPRALYRRRSVPLKRALPTAKLHGMLRATCRSWLWAAVSASLCSYARAVR